MINQIKHLTKVQLCNFLNLNVLKFSKDKQKRRTMLGLTAVWFILAVMLVFYVGALSYGYIQIGLGTCLAYVFDNCFKYAHLFLFDV